MAIAFPTTPTTGDTYTYSGKTWTWNGSLWQANNTPMGPTGPTGPQGVTGPTGANTTVNVTGPVTNSGTTTAAVIGLNSTVVITTASQTLSNKTLMAPKEQWYSAGSFSGASNYDVKTFGGVYAGVQSYSSSNFSFNFRGDASTTLDSMLAVGETISISVINLNNTTGYYCSGVTVDTNATVSVLWSGGTAPSSGNVSSKDIYQFSIFKQATSNFIVFAAGPIKYA